MEIKYMIWTIIKKEKLYINFKKKKERKYKGVDIKQARSIFSFNQQKIHQLVNDWNNLILLKSASGKSFWVSQIKKRINIYIYIHEQVDPKSPLFILVCWI